jgi:hypothetical protein
MIPQRDDSLAKIRSVSREGIISTRMGGTIRSFSAIPSACSQRFLRVARLHSQRLVARQGMGLPETPLHRLRRLRQRFPVGGPVRGLVPAQTLVAAHHHLPNLHPAERQVEAISSATKMENGTVSRNAQSITSTTSPISLTLFTERAGEIPKRKRQMPRKRTQTVRCHGEHTSATVTTNVKKDD